MKNKQHGFVLFMTLLNLSIISLLFLSCMHQLLLYFQAINSHDQQQYQFFQLERIALQLAKMKSKNIAEKCLAPLSNANLVLSQLKEGKGCTLSLNRSQFRYLIEELGDFPCLIATKGQQQVATKHRRVSLLFLEKQQPKQIVQIRYITQTVSSSCLAQKRTVRLGLSAWRHLWK